MTTKKSEKEEKREIGLTNLKSPIAQLGATYLVENIGGYGENGNSAVDQFIYSDAMKSAMSSEEGQNLMYGNLMNSRQGGKRYTGNVSEYQILENSMAIVQDSLKNIKVQDALKIMGSNVSVEKKYNEKYVGDLLSSKKEEEKKVGELIIGTYQQSLADQTVSTALENRAQSLKEGGLERELKKIKDESKKKGF